MKEKVDMNGKIILVTGAAGFIGSNLISALLSSAEHCTMIGIDNLNDYYDPTLKEYRLKKLKSAARSKAPNNFKFIEGDISRSGSAVSWRTQKESSDE